MKVSAASATIADSMAEMPATEYSTRPSEAATSTMQMATKIVEMRITRARSSTPKLRARPGGVTLALLLIRKAGVVENLTLRRAQGIGHHRAAGAQRLRMADGG